MSQKSEWGGKSWGEFVNDEGHRVEMFRKGAKVRFFDSEGRQFGPEQRNVAPAIAAMSAAGYYDPALRPLYHLAAARGEFADTSRRSRRTSRRTSRRSNPTTGMYPLVEIRIRKFPGYASGYETYVTYFKDAQSKGTDLDRQASELKREALYAARFFKDFALGPRGDAQRVLLFDGGRKIGSYARFR